MHIIYDYNFLGQKHYTITSKDIVPTGQSTLGFAFNKTGRYKDVGTLFINDKQEGRTRKLCSGLLHKSMIKL